MNQKRPICEQFSRGKEKKQAWGRRAWEATGKGREEEQAVKWRESGSQSSGYGGEELSRGRVSSLTDGEKENCDVEESLA